MVLYNTPYWLRMLAGPGLTWEMPASDNALYLTFDDGPDPETTPYILDILKQFKAKATFFCVGENVIRYPDIYQKILDAGHAVGNHSHNHPKGWETQTKKYVENVAKCKEVVNSDLFRPPYGKMKHAQRRALKNDYRIIMWTVLSRDYDAKVNKETCLKKTWKYTRPGAIVVFHDHKKAMRNLEYVLPKYLERAAGENYSFSIITNH